MSQIKAAIKGQNTIALESIRSIKSELLLIKTAEADASVSESQEITLLTKMIKQRKEAAEQFKNNGREEAAEKEIAQAEIIQSFLPEQISEEKLTEELKMIIAEIGAESPKDMGKVMGIATKKFAGKAEGKKISATVKQLLEN